MAGLTVGAVCAVALLAPRGRTTTPMAPLVWLLFIGSSVHVAASGWLFSIGDVRRHALAHSRRYVYAPLALVSGGMVLALVASPSVLAWVLLGFFAWQFHHFQRQNVGMVALATTAGRLAGLTRGERRSIMAAGLCGIAALLTRPALLQLDIRSPVARMFDVALIGFVVAAGVGLGALARRHPRERPAGYCAIYVAALLFPLPIFVFAGPYAAVAGLTVAHGAQYLVLLSLVAAGAPRRAAEGVAVLVAMALVGGAVLSLLSHLHASASGVRVLFGVYLGVAASHFVVDAGVWRLRDGFVRGFLSARLPHLVPAKADAA